jgi:hypothetical protein
LQLCIGLSMILVAASLFVFSINRASASGKFPTPKDFMARVGGKIYMCLRRMFGSRDSKGGIVSPSYGIMIMDTETGKTVSYVSDADNGWKWVKDGSQVPANPF